MTFKERLEIVKEYRKWFEETNGKNDFDLLDCPETLMAFLQNRGLLNERSKGEWIPISERLPREKLFNLSGSDFGFDFEEVLCTTIWENVRVYKFGKPIGYDKPHFWLGGRIMDEYVIAWQSKPEPYKESEAENE